MSSDRILLVGPRAAGKTAVGAALGARRGLAFVDADDEVERATGKTVAALLANGVFRGWEAEVLATLLLRPAGVVAAGAGAVLWPGLRAAAAGWSVLWLDAAPDVRAARIRGDGARRPSLTGRPADLELAAFAYRALAYDALALHRVDTTSCTVGQVVDRIEKLLKSTDSPDSRVAD